MEIKNICSGYGTKQIVNNISFSVKEGELCAVLGLNGCGKSTLIKTLCGLIKPVSGSCFYGDTDLWKLNEKERAKVVSYIPQRGSKIDNRTALDVVLMGFNPYMSVFESYNNQQRNKALTIMKELGVSELANKIYEQLSEGQKQIIILARTRVQNTAVVIMDEPDSSLDFSNKNSVIRKIRDIVSNEKKIGLMILHDPNIAMSYCNKIFLMQNGCLVSTITADDYTDFNKLETKLSYIYGNIRILDNNGLPVMVGK